MSVCGGWSIIRHTGPVIEGRTLFCRSWQCPDCGPRRAGKLARFAADGKPTTFVTLTVNPSIGESPEQRARSLSDAWKVLVKRCRRKFTKQPIEYLAVFEETKRGEPHLHILLRAPFIPQRWLSQQMQELIQAPIVDIRKVGHFRNAARYVSKYVGKGPKPFAALKRYWSSPGYDLNPMTKDKSKGKRQSPWRIQQMPLWQVMEEMARWLAFPHIVDWDAEHHCVLRRHNPRTPVWSP